MKGNAASRALRLLGNLLSHPGHAVRYARTLPLWKRMPIDLELPWISFGAIDYLERFVGPTQDVFEFGSGGSSIFLAKRARSVHSVENDRRWHASVVERSKRLGLTNMRCELHEFGDHEAHRFRELSYFSAIGRGPYDVILVDGFCGFTTGPYGQLRPYAFELALEAVRRPGGIIVVDDYWMFPDIAARVPEVRPIVFETTGPVRYGVTSTAVFEF